ncbi:MAG TPA: hypothetical protein VMR66_04215 [Gemmatimonadota bacterium]|nr:hypothetical protein [Gemmatimonadota bacterium]
MRASASSLLARLERIRDHFGGSAAVQKLELLDALAGRSLPDANRIARLHDALTFLRAYPDDADVLDRVEAMLGSFADRADLRRNRRGLVDSGIAGTELRSEFYWPTALWLAERWPDRLSVDWRGFENASRLVGLLHLLVPYSETPGLDGFDYSAEEWSGRLKGPKETDAEFLVKRFRAMRADSFGRETLYDQLDIPIRLSPGPGTPSRTKAKVPSRIHFQTRPLDRTRPDVAKAVRTRPRSVRPLSGREGRRLVDLAREAMVTRSRDLDAFAYADPGTVRMVDCGDGLQFACMGTRPERRLLFEAVHGFLTLKNGVPIGYVLLSALFRSVEVAYNVFDTYRGGEAARVYGHVLAMARELFHAETFAVNPYQLGYDNEEGLKSGAWWFYYKLGFRPDDPRVKRLVRRELAHLKKAPRHRSGVATLEKLSSEYLFLDLAGRNEASIGRIDLGTVGLGISRYLARRFGADRERGIRTCAEEAAALVGLRSFRRLPRGERIAWDRWAPLVCMIPGIRRWSAKERRDLGLVVRAKGGIFESDFVLRFDRHAKLGRAVRRLAEMDA